MCSRDWVEFLERELAVGKLALVLGRVVDMTFADALCVAFRYKLDESVL